MCKTHMYSYRSKNLAGKTEVVSLTDGAGEQLQTTILESKNGMSRISRAKVWPK